MIGRITSFVIIIAGLVLAYLAYERFAHGNSVAAELEMLRFELADLQLEEQKLAGLPHKPLQTQGAAMSDFILALRSEVDLLGATARITLPGKEVVWEPQRHGVVSTKFKIDVTTLEDGAPAILAMVAERMQSRAMRILNAEVARLADIVVMRVDIELFGRAE